MGILNYQDSVLSRAFVARRKGRLQARDVRQIITLKMKGNLFLANRDGLV
jgi:hypothetical protein